jgi:AraC-like DNA-binding protein
MDPARMAATSTTITSWALLIWKALLNHGVDPHAVFKQAGMDPAKLGDGKARYRLADMTRLWAIAIEHTDNPCLGLAVGKLWAPTTFHALGFAWLASHSLKDALQRLVRYSRIVNNSLTVSLEESGMQLNLCLSSHEDARNIHYAAHDASIVTILVMCRFLCGQDFSPLAIHSTRPRSVCAEPIDQFAGTSIIYNSDADKTVFDRIRAEQRLATGNSELSKVNEEVALKYLVSIDRTSILMLVKSTLVELMPTGQVTEETVAASLNLSLRTLQRKLSDEGTTFAALYQSLRQEMAQQYIRDSQMSLTEIAYLLGFSEQSNFTRAFRRWYGTSPSAARHNLEHSAFA